MQLTGTVPAGSRPQYLDKLQVGLLWFGVQVSGVPEHTAAHEAGQACFPGEQGTNS
jgi:hypothetical protein